jgi:Tfp pilus assembly protein PilF
MTTTMIKKLQAAAAIVLLAAAVGVQAQQAQEGARPEIGKPLQAAYDLMKAGKYREALGKIREADAVPNPNPYERFMLDRIRGAAAAGAGDDATASRSFEAALNSGRLQPAESLPLLESLASSAYRSKDYGKAIEWAKRYFQAGGNSEQMRSLKTASHYQMGDYAGVVNDMQAKIKSVEDSAPVVDEATLRMLAASYAKLNDQAGYALALDKLLFHHPKKEYWDERLLRLQATPGFPERLMLDLYRLRMATGTLDAQDQYLEIAQLALQAGLPFEAKRIVEAGYAAGKLGTGSDAPRHKRLRDLAAKQAAEDEKALGVEVVGRTGEAQVNTGMALVSAGRLDKGIELLEHGLAKGDVKRPDEARLHLGQAYLQAGKKAKAIETFKSIRSADVLGEMGRLWAIYAART